MEAFVRGAEEAEAAGREGAEEGEEEEEAEDDEALFFGGGGAAARGRSRAGEDGEDEEAAAAIAFSARLAGGGGKRARLAPRAGDDEGLGGADLMYEDFFGPRGGRGRPPRRGEEEAGEAEEEEEEEMEEAGLPDEQEEEEEEEGAAAEAGGDDGMAALSAHARRAARLAAQVRELESRNMRSGSQKDWQLRGEVRGGDRPLNSALEVALDFDHATAPPPVVTAAATASLEELIRARCAEGRWDDVQRRAPPPPPRASRRPRAAEGEEEKSKKGLAELYEEEYLKERAAAEAAAAAAAARAGGASAAAAAAGAAAAGESAEATAARALFTALSAKLDALSHFSFAPKPHVADLEVKKAGLPALALEEVAPAAVSDAALRAPREVYAGGEGAGKAAGGARGSAAGVVAADAELSGAQLKARRAKKKRKGMGAAKEKESRLRRLEAAGLARRRAAEAAGFEAPAQRAGAASARGARSDFAKSSKVFARLQEGAEADKADAAAGRPSAAQRLKAKAREEREGGMLRAANLKL